MERYNDIGMLDLMARPAFCVREGRIIRVNRDAAAYQISPDTELAPLLRTGAEEYAAFQGGCLYLTLELAGRQAGASVTRLAEYDVFCLEEPEDDRELRAMALAAQTLRRPLNAVMVTVMQLFPVCGDADDPEAQARAGRINRGLNQMMRVINNMSDAGNNGVSAARMETVNIVGILDEVFEKAAAQLEQTGIRLSFRSYPEPIYCLANSQSLERAVLNMVSNAAKFSPPGGIIHAELARRGSKLYLTVEDHGSGMSPAVRDDVFNRYRRSCALEDERFGIGLGMVLIRAAAAAHGGAVLIDQPGSAGSRITMSLAIRQNQGQLRSGILPVDYSGGMDHSLMELSEVLPPSLYESEN